MFVLTRYSISGWLGYNVPDAALLRRERRDELGRKIKSTAVPIVILRPMGPVMMVYEVADTEGAPLPPSSLDLVEGEVSHADLRRLITRANADGIEVQVVPLGIRRGGDARAVDKNALPTDFLIRLNLNHSLATQFKTLCHELAHIYCGHCGRPKVDSWWMDRSRLGLAEMEFEAEGAAHLVMARAGLDPTRGISCRLHRRAAIYLLFAAIP